MPSVDPAHAVLLVRIRMALHRATGKAHNVDALLGTAEQAAASIAQWRSLGLVDLNHLLDLYEHGSASAAPAPGWHERTDDNLSRGGPIIEPPESPGARQAKPGAEPVDPDTPTPPADRRYIRGAR